MDPSVTVRTSCQFPRKGENKSETTDLAPKVPSMGGGGAKVSKGLVKPEPRSAPILLRALFKGSEVMKDCRPKAAWTRGEFVLCASFFSDRLCDSLFSIVHLPGNGQIKRNTLNEKVSFCFQRFLLLTFFTKCKRLHLQKA